VVLAVVLSLLVGYVVRDLNAVFGPKDIAFNDGACELLGGDQLKGGEDLTLWRDGVAIATAGDLKTTFRRGGSHAELTGVFAVSMVQAGDVPAGTVRKLELVGFPATSRLAGHGVFLSNKTQLLYVVNHGDELTRVEIFGIEGKSFRDLRLNLVGRIESDLIPWSSANDVVEGEGVGEVFVSIWKTTRTPKEFEEKQDLLDVFNILAYRYLPINLGSLGVLRCTGSKEAWTCARTAAWGIPMANGLAVSPDRKTLLVSCPLCNEIWRYSVGPGGNLTEVTPRIPLPYPADNLDWDEATGRVLMGTLPAISVGSHVPMELMAFPTQQLSQGSFQFESLLRHDGTKLSQSSAGVQYGEAMLLGSPYYRGLLLCHGATNVTTCRFCPGGCIAGGRCYQDPPVGENKTAGTCKNHGGEWCGA